MAQLFNLTGQALRDTAGNPYTSAKAFFYETGTTTPKDTYSNAGLTSANANPVIADGTTGLFPDIYLLAGRYKVVLQQSDGTSIDTWDPVDATSQMIAASSAPSPTYAFLRYHNTTDGNVYRRNAANSAWINEGPVDTLLNAATVTEQLAGTETGKSSTPDSVAALLYRGSDITAASTLSLPSSGGGVYNLTGGATTITGISSAAGGRAVRIRYNAAHSLTHDGTSFILLGGASRTVASGAVSCFVNEAATDATGSNWREFSYHSATGSPASVVDFVASQAEQETGTDVTKIVTPGRQHFHDSALKAWTAFDGTGTPTATDVYNFASGAGGITDNGTGDYTLTFTTALSTAAGYAAVGMCNQVSAGNVSANQMCVQGATAGNVLAASCRVNTGNASSGAAADENYNGVVFAGDI